MRHKRDNVVAIVFLAIVFSIIAGFMGIIFNAINKNIIGGKNNLRILSSYENRNFEDVILKYSKKQGYNVDFEYMGDLDIVSELNKNSSNYDAVWISNSMWLYMLDNSYLTTDSKSISISPVVFGIRKSKAESLGLTNKEITNDDILNLIKEKQIKYVMPSVTQTNTGATAYLGFISSLSGNPEILTDEILYDETLRENLINLFQGVHRVSGDEKYLEDMFINDDGYEAIIASESSLININKKLEQEKKETIYFLYPTDGVSINDSTFAFIKNDESKEEKFLDIQNYLLSDEGQKLLKDNGQRTWYGGVSNDKSDTFKKEWGIDTTKYLNVTKFPSKSMITKAMNLYIEDLRKPTHVVFCLDYSGSMYGSGQEELTDAMNYILEYEKAKKDNLQFSKDDKITVITFSSKVEDIWSTDSGLDTKELINNINNKETNSTTALYDAVIKGLEILSEDSDDCTKTIIAMTDGAVNVGSFNDLNKKYNSLKSDVPIYSIMFGSAREDELEEIAKLSNARVFDGRTNLLGAFKEVRGYN